jgi:hypothetical protein
LQQPLVSQLVWQADRERYKVKKARQDATVEIYGVSDKVLTMALSGILIGAADDRPGWLEVGVQLIAVDTLVHNFLPTRRPATTSGPSGSTNRWRTCSRR